VTTSLWAVKPLILHLMVGWKAHHGWQVCRSQTAHLHSLYLNHDQLNHLAQHLMHITDWYVVDKLCTSTFYWLPVSSSSLFLPSSLTLSNSKCQSIHEESKSKFPYFCTGNVSKLQWLIHGSDIRTYAVYFWTKLLCL